MRRKLGNRLAMVGATVAVLNQNKNVWESTPAFFKAVADLAAIMKQTEVQSGIQQTPTTGATATKTQARDALEDTALEIADQLSALAEDLGNPDLAAKVEITRSALDKLNDDELETIAKRIETLATANLALLAEYLVTQEDIAELALLIGEFSALKTAPRVAVVERSSSTSALPDLSADASRILRCRIDKMVSRFRNKNPEFVAKYRAARVIVDRSGPTKSKEAKTPVPAGK